MPPWCIELLSIIEGTMTLNASEIVDVLPCGARLHHDGGCRWRVWAPAVRSLDLILHSTGGKKSRHSMEKEFGGYYTCHVNGIRSGQRYTYRLNDERELPDPASQWQPDGIHEASAVWEPGSFEWTDGNWKGIPKEELVLYEIHVGTFTPSGTFAGIIPRLKQLRDLGVTALQLMPVAQFAGRWNWGYDAVFWNAVQNTYGGPRELQSLVNACHETGLSVFLDVVYNHLGPEGNYLCEFGPYLTDQFRTPWGPALNYHGCGCQGVRTSVCNNVRQWIRDFHVDGLRLDAVHAFYDLSGRHILGEIKATAADEAARSGKHVCIIAESNLNDASLLLPEAQGGYDFDAQWNDDFHHCVHTLLTSESSGYYVDYPAPQTQLVKVLERVFAYDGDYSEFRGHRHGVPVENRQGDQFVISIQNHDQIGNRACGERLADLTGPAQLRLAASLMLLSPYTPQLFMGEEFGATTPFPFFCDFSDSTTRTGVRLGRLREFPEFAGYGKLPDPLAEATFLSAQLNWPDTNEYSGHGLYQLYHDLLSARREWEALRDREYRTARKIESIEGQTVLFLGRGNPAEVSMPLEIFFNLTQHNVTLRSDLYKGLEPLLRSEDIRYGGSAWGGRFWGQLKPYECIILKRSSTGAPLPAS